MRWIPVVAMSALSLLAACGSDGNDCKHLAYDPTGTWHGTLLFDESQSNIGPPAEPIAAAHRLRFDDCALVLTDHQDVRYQLIDPIEASSLHFRRTGPGPTDLDVYVTQRDIIYKDGADEIAEVLYRVTSQPPRDVLYHAWSGVMRRDP